MIRLVLMLLCIHTCCYSAYSLNEMSIEEKVGQILMCHFNGKEVNDDAKTLIQDLYVGGIIYYNWANELSSPEQVFTLSTKLQQLSRNQSPLLIAIDQEGGVVTRLTEGFTSFPGNGALGIIKDPDLAEKAAYAIGTELHAVGINMNLAPIVDVNSNPYNPVIGIRSFGDSVSTVISLARRTIQGYHKAHVLTSLKHFPGHGDVTVDSHETLPVIKKSLHQLQQVELFPFKALAADTDSIMTAHLMVPSLDTKRCATLSKKILNVLRERCQFPGLIISDSLMMEGLLKQCSPIEETSLQAFLAGCDMLLLGGKQLVGTSIGYELTVADIAKIHAHLVQAVKTGVIPLDRLDASVQRILDIKAKYDLLPPKILDLETIRSKKHLALAERITKKAIRVVKESSLSISTSHTIAVFAPMTVQKALEHTPLLQLGFSLLFSTCNPNEQETKDALQLADQADLSIFCSYNAWANPSQASLIQALIAQGKPVYLLVLRDPIDTTLFPNAQAIVISFSPTAPSIEAAYKRLMTCENTFEKRAILCQ